MIAMRTTKKTVQQTLVTAKAKLKGLRPRSSRADQFALAQKHYRNIVRGRFSPPALKAMYAALKASGHSLADLDTARTEKQIRTLLDKRCASYRSAANPELAKQPKLQAAQPHPEPA